MKKKIALLLAAVLVMTSLTACNNTDTVENDPANDVVIAHVDGTGMEGFDITYGDWNKEYQFYLLRNGLDDTLEENASTCEGYRQQIIEYLTLERIVLRVAEELGVGVSSLTADELTEIDTAVQDSYKSWCTSYETEAIAALGETYTDEELYNKEYELFSEFMAKAGLNPEIFVTWQTNATIQTKLYEFIVKDATTTDAEAIEYLKETEDAAKEAYENDLETFENNSTYTAVYVPDGTRIVEQIFVKLEDDDITEITAYRNAGDNESADAMLEEKLAAILPEITAAKEALDAGTAWDEVQTQYNDDTSGNDTTYVVYPKSAVVGQTIIDAAYSIENKGGYSEIISSDYGYYILYFSDVAVMTEGEIENLKSQVVQMLLENKKNEILSTKVKEWTEKYTYVIDYSAINLEDPAATTTTAAETTAA